MKMILDPKYNRRCDLCIHWLEQEKQKVVIVPGQGFIPIRDMIAQGGVPADANVQTVAPCTACPQWSTTVDGHFCGYFEGTSKY